MGLDGLRKIPLGAFPLRSSFDRENGHLLQNADVGQEEWERKWIYISTRPTAFWWRETYGWETQRKEVYDFICPGGPAGSIS